jgi:hypothetical protein
MMGTGVVDQVIRRGGSRRCAAVWRHKGSESAIVLLRVVTTSNAGSVPAFDDSLAAQCIAVGVGSAADEHSVEQIDLESFSEETLSQGWIYTLLKPGKHVVAFNPPEMWDMSTESERWAASAHWAFEVPADAPVVYIGTMQLHCRAEATDLGGVRLRTIRAQKLHDESGRATALAAAHLNGLPSPVTVLPARRHSRESSILQGVR